DAFEVVRQRPIRGFHRMSVMLGDAAQQAFVIGDHSFAAAPPREHRPLFEGFLGVGHNEALVENHFLAKAMADRAGAAGSIEGKMFWSRLFEALAGRGTVIAVRVERLRPRCFVRWEAFVRWQLSGFVRGQWSVVS